MQNPAGNQVFNAMKPICRGQNISNDVLYICFDHLAPRLHLMLSTIRSFLLLASMAQTQSTFYFLLDSPITCKT